MFENETTEELEVRRDAVTEALAHIKTQLAFAKSDAATTGTTQTGSGFKTRVMRCE